MSVTSPHRILGIMRHGKSDWSDDLPDFRRPLNRRGRRDVAKMAAWLRQQPFVPARVYSSTAVRASQTTEILEEIIGGLTVEWLPELYLAEMETLLSVTAGLPDENVLLVGHNPGLEQLVSFCEAHPEGAARFSKLLPTAGVYAFRVTYGSGALGAGCGELLAHQRPKLLPNG